MHTSFQLEVMGRLSSIQNNYIAILSNFDYCEIEMKAQMVEYLIDIHVYHQNWKRDYVYKSTGLNKDGIRKFKDGYVKTDMKTFIKFVFGIGCSFDEAIFLAIESGIDIMGDNDIAKTNLEILNKLNDKKFMEEYSSDRIEWAINKYRDKRNQLIKVGKLRNRK